MSTFSRIAPELLADIFKFSTEGESRKEQQRARFQFGLVSRACYLATANATDVYIDGPSQAEALMSTIMQEQKWVAQEERKARIGRTTRASVRRIKRVSNVRRLIVTLDDERTLKSLVALLHLVGTNLSALELNIGPTFRQYGDGELDSQVAAWFRQLEGALGTVARLQTLHLVSSGVFFSETIVRLLIPLVHLEVLFLDMTILDINRTPNPALFTQLALPHLRQLVVDKPPSWAIWKTLAAASPTSVSNLQLRSRRTDYFHVVQPLLPNLTRFSWTPERQPLDEIARDDVLALLGAMRSLESLSMPLWTLGNYCEFLEDTQIVHDQTEPELDEWDLAPIDRTVFDVVATLPRLRTVELIVRIGTLDDSDIVSFIKSIPSLRTLSIVSKRKRGWTSEEIERVRAAGEEVGVKFVYEGNHTVWKIEP
ncbi:hypothetical protein RQP46_004605 [Phenoliferia psychrophenolica]